jgi:hypothetical protein
MPRNSVTIYPQITPITRISRTQFTRETEWHATGGAATPRQMAQAHQPATFVAGAGRLALRSLMARLASEAARERQVNLWNVESV